MELTNLSASELCDGVFLAKWISANVRSSDGKPWTADFTRLDDARSNSAKRYLNWVILNAEVFTPLGLQLDQEQLSRITEADPREIQRVISLLMTQLEQMSLIVHHADEKESSLCERAPLPTVTIHRNSPHLAASLSLQMPESSTSTKDRAIRIVPLSSSESTNQDLPNRDFPVKILPSQPVYELPQSSHLPSLSEENELTSNLQKELKSYEETNDDFIAQIVQTFKNQKKEQMISLSPKKRSLLAEKTSGDADLLRKCLLEIFETSKRSLQGRLNEIQSNSRTFQPSALNTDPPRTDDALSASQQTIIKAAVETPSTVTPSAMFKSHDFNLESVRAPTVEMRSTTSSRIARHSSRAHEGLKSHSHLVRKLHDLCSAIDECLHESEEAQAQPQDDVRLLKALLRTHEQLSKLSAAKSRGLKDAIAATKDEIPIHTESTTTSSQIQPNERVLVASQVETHSPYVQNCVVEHANVISSRVNRAKATTKSRNGRVRKRKRRKPEAFAVAAKPTVSSSLKSERRGKKKLHRI